MSHNGHHLDHHQIEGLAGMGAEILKQGRYLSAGNSAYRALTGTHLGHSGAHTVQTLARYAPAAVVAMSTAAPPVAIAVGVIYGGYKLFKWLKDNC